MGEHPACPEAKGVCALSLLESMPLLPPGKETGGKNMNGKAGMRISPLLLAVMLVSAVVVSVASAGSAHYDARGVEAPSITVTDDSIRDAVEGVIKEIQESSMDPKEKKELIDDLRAVISESPISMDRLEKSLLNVGRSLFSQDHSIGIMQYGVPVHQEMAQIAGQKMGLGSAECAELLDHADDPDGWGTFCIDHYALTGAPGEAERLANAARAKLSVDDWHGGFSFLAYAMHFMTDMTVPYHYVYEGLLYHEPYEYYVADNWGTAKDFGGSGFRSDATSPTYYYVITDVSDATMDLAEYSHQYLSYINNQMAHNPDWEEDASVIAYTRNCIREGTKYNWGLADYVTR